jgi:hypothetical protein
LVDKTPECHQLEQVGYSESREVLKVVDPSIFMESSCHVAFLLSRLGEK